MNKKITSAIARASAIIALFTLLGRGLGFLREVVIASFFGLSKEYEIYLVAAVLPMSLNTVIIVLGQNYFIPNFYKVAHSDKNRFFIHSFSFLLISSLVLTVLLFIFSGEILNYYINSNSTELKSIAWKIFVILLPSIPLTAAISIFSAYLQSEKCFSIPAISNLFINIFIIISIPFYYNSWGIIVIPVFYIVGLCAQNFYLMQKIKNIGVRLKISFYKFNFSYSIGYFFFFTLIIESLGQMFSIADRYFYDTVDKGGIAALNYSATLFQLPLVILPFAISTVLFPSFSELIQTKKSYELLAKIEKAISVLLFLTIPIAVIFIYFGNFIIKILFQRGNFSYYDSIITASTFKIYAISLSFYAIYSVINKLFYSANLLKELLAIMVFGLFLKIILNFLLVNNLMQDGLALSSAITYIFFCMASLFLLRKLKIYLFKNFIKNLVFYLTNIVLALFVIIFLEINLITKDETFIILMEIIALIAMFLLNCLIIDDNIFKLFKNIIFSKSHFPIKKIGNN